MSPSNNLPTYEENQILLLNEIGLSIIMICLSHVIVIMIVNTLQISQFNCYLFQICDCNLTQNGLCHVIVIVYLRYATLTVIVIHSLTHQPSLWTSCISSRQ